MRSFAVLVVMATTLVACSTSGMSRLPAASSSAAAGRTVFVSKYASAYEQRHLGEVLGVLERHGFTPTRERSAADFTLDFRIQAGATVRVNVGLLKAGAPVIVATSANYGWGTWMARPTAVEDRVDQALQRLETELAEAGW